MITNPIIVNTSIASVRNTIKDFHNMSWASDVIENSEAVGDFSGT